MKLIVIFLVLLLLVDVIFNDSLFVNGFHIDNKSVVMTIRIIAGFGSLWLTYLFISVIFTHFVQKADYEYDKSQEKEWETQKDIEDSEEEINDKT